MKIAVYYVISMTTNGPITMGWTPPHLPASMCQTEIDVSVNDKDEFCLGFSEGYKSIIGNMVVVPICPIATITPIGSTDFRESIKAEINVNTQVFKMAESK